MSSVSFTTIDWLIEVYLNEIRLVLRSTLVGFAHLHILTQVDMSLEYFQYYLVALKKKWAWNTYFHWLENPDFYLWMKTYDDTSTSTRLPTITTLTTSEK